MTNLQDFLSTLRADGVQLWVHDGQLRCRWPAGVEDSEKLSEIRRHKQSILALLTEPPAVSAPALAGAPRPPALPLSYAQEGLWFLDQLGLPGSAYNLSTVVRIEGGLSLPRLRRALDEVVRRHEILRTRLRNVEGVGLQVVDPAGAVDVGFTDLSALDTSEREARARRLLQEYDEHEFALESEHLFRAHVLRLSETEHLLNLTLHHIIVDGSSMGILFRELSVLYAADERGEASPLPELIAQYADYALWQHRWLERGVLDKQLAYWKRRLEGAPESLNLPFDRPRPAVQTFRGEFVAFTFPQTLRDALSELAREQQMTLFMVLAGAFQALLSRWSGQKDVLIGSPVEGRNHPQAAELIGYFANALILRTDFSANPTVGELFKQVKKCVLEAYEHRDLPFDRLVAELRPHRDLSRQPLFQVDFVYQERASAEESLKLPGLKISPVETHQRTAKFDLELLLSDTGAGLEGGFEYASDLFDRETIERMIGHFKTLLEGIVRRPHARVGELPLLGERERRLLLAGFNDTAAPPPPTPTLHRLFEAQAARTPHACALACGPRRLTYAALNARANRLARRLRALGVGPEMVVAVCLRREPELLVGLLAVLKAGGAYLPLDPEYPAERLAFMLEDAGVRVVVTQEGLAGGLGAEGRRVVCVEAGGEEAGGEDIEGTGEENLAGGAGGENLAYVIYTSGSTGRPKGVAVPHVGLVNLVVWHQRYYGLTPSDRATQLAGLGFDASVWEMWPYLTAGASLHLADEEVRLSPKLLVEWLAAESISHCFLPTPLAEVALGEAWPREMALKVLLTGGDRLHRRPPVGSGFSLFNHYGPTENTVVTTSGIIEAGDGTGGSLTIGRPIANTQVYILDRHGEPVPIGVAGELCIGGVGLARGYLNRPGLTAESFRPNPFGEPGSRLYRTGDLARYLRTGEIEFLGRKDDQVQIRGFRVEVGEIETVLTAHPGVRECVVVPLEKAGGETQLAAYVVAEEHAEGDSQAWRRHLNERLPKHMIPSTFIKLSQLPLLPNGKVDRRSLPTPTSRGFRTESRLVGPRDTVEATLADIWREVLGLDEVAIHDDFFDLGGQSLRVIHLISRIRATWGIELPLRTIFNDPTIAELAVHIEALRGLTQASAGSPAGDGQPRVTGEI